MKVSKLVLCVVTLFFGLSPQSVISQEILDTTNDEETTITDYEMAVQFYQPLAENGEPYAQLTLAEIYAEGDGVTKNLVVAFAWLSIASHNGVEEADKLKNDLLSLMTEGEKAQAVALGEAYIGLYTATK